MLCWGAVESTSDKGSGAYTGPLCLYRRNTTGRVANCLVVWLTVIYGVCISFPCCSHVAGVALFGLRRPFGFSGTVGVLDALPTLERPPLDRVAFRFSYGRSCYRRYVTLLLV